MSEPGSNIFLRAAIAAALILLANAVIGAETQVQPTPAAIQPSLKCVVSQPLQTGNNKKTHENGNASNWFENFISGVKWTDVFLVIFSGLLVWVGRRQVRYFAAKERAFVSVKGLNINGLTDPVTNKIIAWFIATTWENSGDTPTRYMNIQIQREEPPLRSDILPANFLFFDSRSAAMPVIPTLIGPKAAIDSDVIGVGIDEMIAVRDGTQFLYIWGWAEYDDVFPGTPRHRTEFCYRILAMGDPTEPTPGKVTFRWTLHNAHNGADDECLAHMRTTSPRHQKKFRFW